MFLITKNLNKSFNATIEEYIKSYIVANDRNVGKLTSKLRTNLKK